MQRISWGGVCIPWRWNELTFRLFFLQNDSGVFWIHKGGKEVRTRSVYHDQERKNPADRWRVSWISMKNWELLFIWKGCPVMPEPLQKPVRLQKVVDTCVITLKMKKDGSLVWILISSKKNNKRESCPNRFWTSPPDVHNAFGQHKNIITHILKICEKYDFAIQL